MIDRNGMVLIGYLCECPPIWGLLIHTGLFCGHMEGLNQWLSVDQKILIARKVPRRFVKRTIFQARVENLQV